MFKPIALLPWLVFSVLAGPLPVFADDLGRLFTTREQRANLNDIRYQAKFAPIPEPVVVTPVVSAAKPASQEPVVSSMTINGVVKPSHGGGTVWLNKQQVERGGVTREGIQVNTGRRNRGGVQIQLPSGADTIVLKPGQKIDVATGTVLEAYEAEPQTDAKSAFAGDSQANAPATLDEASPAAPGEGGSSGTSTGQEILELLRQSVGNLSKKPDKSTSP